MIYVDNMRSKKVIRRYNNWSHLFNIPVDEEELDNFAKKIGLNTLWRQKSGTLDVHYDVTENKRLLAIKNGAIPISMFDGARLKLSYKRSLLVG